jgi:predicted nuclease of predicted toxin-antitoxin system
VLRLASDENFDNEIVAGLRRRQPDLDLVRIQDAGLRQADDPTILAWAAATGRVLLTHDRQTMTDFVHDRIARGLAMPGVVIVSTSMPIGRAIDELQIMACCSAEGEWENQVVYLS